MEQKFITGNRGRLFLVRHGLQNTLATPLVERGHDVMMLSTGSSCSPQSQFARVLCDRQYVHIL